MTKNSIKGLIPSPDRSICLSSFFGFGVRRQSRRTPNPKNSECGEQEIASKN